MRKHIAAKLRENEEIHLCEAVKAFYGSQSRRCYLAIVFNKTSSFDLALFLFRPSRKFLVKRKIELVAVFPITSELTLFQRELSFSVQWLDYQETEYEIKSKDSSLYIFLLNHFNEASFYQRQPFKAGSPTHQWIWFYQESIPSKIKELSLNPETQFNARPSIRFQPEHFGKEIMTSYIKEQLRKRESEYAESGEIKVFIGSWNCAGTLPSDNLAKWLRMNEEVPNGSYDVIIICLQEICELSAINMLGDENSEERWNRFLKEQLTGIFPDASYKIISSQALVGILSVLFIKDSLAANLSNISVNQVKLGLKGYMGNKGAISLRFEYLSSSFCIVNCHLAAHKAKVKNRNENVQSILKQARFMIHGREMKIYEHDYVMWVGDLNYRIQGVGSNELRRLIEIKNFNLLLNYDQLNNQKATESILSDFFEACITFPPTYKYVKGSSDYTEKREPSWCDRILCRGPAIYKKYVSCQDVVQSDHKPISALLVVPVKDITIPLKKKVKQEIISEINNIYQTAVDSIEYSVDSILFEKVFYKKLYKKNIGISNKGQSLLFFSVIRPGYSWIEISPISGRIPPKQTAEIELAVCISEKIVSKANYLDEFLNCKIDININKTIIKSIPLDIDFKRSCFGSSFEDLIKITVPVSSIPYNIKESAEKSQRTFDVPKELHLLIELIKRSDSNFENLFELPSDPLEVQALRTYLDTLINPEIPIKIQSVWKVLIEMLNTLPTSLINFKVFDTFIERCTKVDDGCLKLRLLENMSPIQGLCAEYIFDLCNFLYEKSKALIDELVEEIMHSMLKLKRNSRDKKAESKRKLFIKIMIIE